MIEIKDLTKRYGKTAALDSFSLTVEEPGIYCLLGRNGAGKTTLLKTLAGHIPASSGRALVNGYLAGVYSKPEDVYFVENDGAQFNMRLKNLLEAAAAVNTSFDLPFATQIAGRFGLDLKKRYKQLSSGMKAMTNALIALASGREIILLDEPVIGLDPIMRKTFYDLLQEGSFCNEKKPKTIIVSTHIIDEIAKVAQNLIIIDKGKPVLCADINEIDEKAYCVTGMAQKVTEATAGLRILSETKAGGLISRSIYDKRIEDSDMYTISAVSLQDFFIGLVGGEKEAI